MVRGLVPWPAAAESEPVRWIVFEDNTVQKDDIRAQKMAFIDAPLESKGRTAARTAMRSLIENG